MSISTNENGTGIVYILTNPAMPDLLKIGFAKADVVRRIRDLSSSTSVPFPFECVMAKRVADAQALEKALHRAFDKFRVNPRREFFEMEPEEATALVAWAPGEDVTPEVEASVQQDADKVEKSASATYRRKRLPNFDFAEHLELEIGTEIEFKYDRNMKATVAGTRKVIYEGEERWLSSLTQQLLDTTNNIPPLQYWYHPDGRLLKQIYSEFFEGT